MLLVCAGQAGSTGYIQFKNFLLRAVKKKMVRFHAVHNMLQEMYKLPMEAQIPSIRELHQKIVDEDPQAGELVKEIYQNCRPLITINMGEGPDDSKMAFKISQTLGNILSIEADYFGFIFKDQSVLLSIRSRKPFLPNYRDSLAVANISRIANRIVKFWHKPVKDSAVLLLDQVQKDFESHRPYSVSA